MLWCAWTFRVGFNSGVNGDASMIIHCMHAATLAVIRLILIKESNVGMNGCHYQR